MQEPSPNDAPGSQHNRNLDPDPVTLEIRALLQRVRASIHAVEAAMMVDSDEPARSDGFFILDDLTPGTSQAAPPARRRRGQHLRRFAR